jgi:hypothetical protein
MIHTTESSELLPAVPLPRACRSNSVDLEDQPILLYRSFRPAGLVRARACRPRTLPSGQAITSRLAINQIRMDVRNFGATYLSLRLLFVDFGSMGPANAHTPAVSSRQFGLAYRAVQCVGVRSDSDTRVRSKRSAECD